MPTPLGHFRSLPPPLPANVWVFYLCATRPLSFYYLCATVRLTNGASVETSQLTSIQRAKVTNLLAPTHCRFLKIRYFQAQPHACDFRATTTGFSVAIGHLSLLNCRLLENQKKKYFLLPRKDCDYFRDMVAPPILALVAICSSCLLSAHTLFSTVTSHVGSKTAAIFCHQSCYP